MKMLLKWVQYPRILLNRNNLGVGTKSKLDQSIIIDSTFTCQQSPKEVIVNGMWIISQQSGYRKKF